MDALLQKLTAQAGTQVVNFAFRSGLSLASGYAFKTLTNFLEKLPETEKDTLEKTKQRLHTKINIIIPAIDLIEIVAARGNTSLDRTIELTKDLKRDIDHFETTIGHIEDDSVDSAASAAAQAESSMKELLARIEEAIPLISLALTTSGANMSSTLPASVSPGKLLLASNILTTADSEFNKKNPTKLQIGPRFLLTLYTPFYANVPNPRNPHRAKNYRWKEEYAKCLVSLWRVQSNLTYAYRLEIHEDLEDGRYHDSEEKPALRTVDVSIITRLYFTANGKLLEIEDANTAVLVLKVNKVFHPHLNDEDDVNYEQDEQWLAFEVYTDDDEYEDQSAEEEQADQNGNPPDISALSLTEHDKLSADRSSLSLLEYLIRLAALQVNDQASMYEIEDERISLYLRDDSGKKEERERTSSPRTPKSVKSMSSLSPRSVRSSLSRSAGRPTQLRTPISSGSPSQVQISNPSFTPWEKDRYMKNPVLRRVVDDTMDSPLRRKADDRSRPSRGSRVERFIY
jgi:hypothetical protein